MKISVITPFYEGDKYMDNLVNSLIANEEELENIMHMFDKLKS